MNPFTDTYENIKFNRRNSNNAHLKPHGSGGFSERFVSLNFETNTPGTSKNFRNTTLLEREVGITEYLSKLTGFNGVIKSRFTDFQVNEIDLQGNVLELNDLTILKPPVNLLSDEELNSITEDTKDFITAENWKLIEKLSCNDDDSTGISLRIDVTNVNKQRRTKLHNIIRQKFNGRLISNTIDDTNNSKYIELKRKLKGNKEKRRKKWEFEGGDYVHFLLHKENVDTTEITYFLAQALSIKPSNINYCGNKDKRANTTQQCSVKQCTPASIVRAAMRMPRVKVGNFQIKPIALRLGQLMGNRFRIALRYVDGNQTDMEVALQHLRDYGCINYFGMQRFGNNAEVPTWEVGVALLKNNYKLAIELILKPRPNEASFMQEIRKKWWKERDSQAAFAMFRKNDKSIECKLMRGLAELGETDYCGALRQAPRNLLMLFPHALQSIIFNRIASRRIMNFGLAVMVGDLVYQTEDEEMINSNEESKDEEDNNDADGKEEEIYTTNKTKAIKMLTKEDIESGKYTIFDVLVTMPGFDVIYPENEVGKWYEEFLAMYTLTFDDFRNKNKTFELSGTYRKLLLRPIDLTWEFCRFKTPDQQLIASDIDKLKGNVLNLNECGPYRALILNFSLPSSCYATMVLRELLKRDTSTAAQAALEKKLLDKANEEIREMCSIANINAYCKRQRSLSESNTANMAKDQNFLPEFQIKTEMEIEGQPVQRKRCISEKKAEHDDTTSNFNNFKEELVKVEQNENISIKKEASDDESSSNEYKDKNVDEEEKQEEALDNENVPTKKIKLNSN